MNRFQAGWSARIGPVQLPDAPDLGVDDGLRPLAVGGLVAMLDQLLRLLDGERQADRPQALDLQPGQQGGDAAADAERAGSIDLAEGLAELPRISIATGTTSPRSRRLDFVTRHVQAIVDPCYPTQCCWSTVIRALSRRSWIARGAPPGLD